MNRLFESKDCKEQLEHLGRCLAMRCGGVALVAQSLGYMLRSMTFDEWKSVRDSDIWNVSATRDARSPQHKVLASLRLSYNSMPPYLKLCFGYCATFPKGYNIAKGGLIHQWISLGLHWATKHIIHLATEWKLCSAAFGVVLSPSFKVTLSESIPYKH
jgi:NAD(P)-dependent dehydrogenase (short-subunit alcohol dehydrogenase family)